MRDALLATPTALIRHGSVSSIGPSLGFLGDDEEALSRSSYMALMALLMTCTSVRGGWQCLRSSRSCDRGDGRHLRSCRLRVSPATVIGFPERFLGYSLYDTVVVFDKVRELTADVYDQKHYTFADASTSRSTRR